MASRVSTSPSSLDKRLTLIACILGSGIVFLDGTVVNVALPAIERDLRASLADQQWIIASYLLTLGSLLLVGGALGDRFGKRRLFLAGLVLFGVTSLLCAIAPNATILIAARALQGVAGALLTPAPLAIISVVYPHEERAAAIGSWTAWGGIATVIGPFVGGALVDTVSWRWIFLLNLPIVVVAMVVALRIPAVADERERDPGTIDVVGAVLCAAGLGLAVFGLIQQPDLGWTNPLVAGSIVPGLVLLVLFVVAEARNPHAMMPLWLFNRANFTVGNLACVGIYGGLGGALFYLPIFLQQVQGMSALLAGLSLLPVSILMFLLASRFGALADRMGPKLFMTTGPLVAAAGLLLLQRLDRTADLWFGVVPAMTVFGLGLAITVAPLTAAILDAVDDQHFGVGSGVNNAVTRIAGLIAIPIVGLFVSGAYNATLDERLGRVQLSPESRQVLASARTQPLTLVSAPNVQGVERTVIEESVAAAAVAGMRGAAVSGAILVALGGLISFAGIQNSKREDR